MTTFVPAIRTFSSTQRTATLLRWMPLIVMALLMLAMLAFPELAFAQDAKAKIGESAKKAYDLIFTIVYWVCAISVVVAGVGAMFGRMEWGRFGQIVVGIVVVFGATKIVEYFQ